jgi:hypothetical protein
VHTREQLFDGPFVERAPDLLLELRLDRGYSYNLLPSPDGKGPFFSRLPAEQYLGKKGRSLPGSHRARGLLIAAGPRVRACGQLEASIEDSSALVLERIGVALPTGARGRAPKGALFETGQALPLPDVSLPRVRAGNVAALEARLRALGYVD